MACLRFVVPVVLTAAIAYGAWGVLHLASMASAYLLARLIAVNCRLTL